MQFVGRWNPTDHLEKQTSGVNNHLKLQLVNHKNHMRAKETCNGSDVCSGFLCCWLWYLLSSHIVSTSLLSSMDKVCREVFRTDVPIPGTSVDMENVDVRDTCINTSPISITEKFTGQGEVFNRLLYAFTTKP